MNPHAEADGPLDGGNSPPRPSSREVASCPDRDGALSGGLPRRSTSYVHTRSAAPTSDTQEAGGIEVRADMPAVSGQSPDKTEPEENPGDATPSRVAIEVGEGGSIAPRGFNHKIHALLDRIKHIFVTFSKFIGPGFMISVAYIDPGNYSTDIAAGASYRFRLLFIVLLSNLIAIFLQSLCIKLGTVSGLNLAQACRMYLPRWLNLFLYLMIEAAIIATDIAEVIGTAIAINLLLPQVPLVAGCAISILDVMIILLFYRPNGSMKGLRTFEVFVALLVVGVVVCFCIQLSLIQGTSVGEVLQGYLPSSPVVQQQGLYQSCGILGATVMPHSLYLGSGIVQSRLRDYDAQKGLLPPGPIDDEAEGGEKFTYIPSLAAIRFSLKYSIAELSISLFTFALFVNSAILIVAGASLYGNQNALSADIFDIHALLSSSISPAAGTIFALALLMSGISAGIVCTIAGQMASEGALNWTMKPWLRRLVTRSVSITPSIIIAGAVGRHGLDAALNGSQVALSVVLPFVSAPLLWFTSRSMYMTVRRGNARFSRLARISLRRVDDEEDEGEETEAARGVVQAGRVGSGGNNDADGVVTMANSWWITVLAVLVWLLITVMNIANLVLVAMGES